VTCEPRAYSPRTGVVSRCGQSEVAKLIAQFAQIPRRVAQRVHWVERVSKAVPAGRLGHELSNARCPLGADGTSIETAFLPDHASEKFDGERVLRRCLLQRPTNLVRGRCMRSSSRLGLSGRWCCACLRIRMPAPQRERTSEQRSGEPGHALDNDPHIGPIIRSVSRVHLAAVSILRIHLGFRSRDVRMD
jgi:hypothetical protein